MEFKVTRLGGITKRVIETEKGNSRTMTKAFPLSEVRLMKNQDREHVSEGRSRDHTSV